MLEEPSDLHAGRVLDLVREHWHPRARSARHLPLGSGAHHWEIANESGPRWFATVDRPLHVDTLGRLTRAYGTARRLAESGEDYVLAPEPTTTGALLVPAGHGRLLSLTPFIRGTSGPGHYRDDDERTEVAALLGRLHSAPVPHECGRWHPEIRQLDDFVALLDSLDHAWRTGPFGEPARVRMLEKRDEIRRRVERFHLLSATLAGASAANDWVLTHGEPHTANVLWTGNRIVLVDWESSALAPRERDLRVVLRGADGSGPQDAYVAAGGSAQLMSPDILELLDLEWQLNEIAEYTLRFRGPHTGGADDERCYRDLVDELP